MASNILLSGKQRDRLSIFIMSYLRNLVGKGPEDVRVLCTSDTVTAIISGVLTKIEKAYHQRCKDTKLIHQLHDGLFRSAAEDFRQFFLSEFGLILSNMSSETDLEFDTRTLFFEFKSRQDVMKD